MKKRISTFSSKHLMLCILIVIIAFFASLISHTPKSEPARKSYRIASIDTSTGDDITAVGVHFDTLEYTLEEVYIQNIKGRQLKVGDQVFVPRFLTKDTTHWTNEWTLDSFFLSAN